MKRTTALALAAVGATMLAVGALASSSATTRPLVFATNGDGVSGTLELATVRPDGSRFRKLARYDPPAFSPRWTTDGKSIVFYSDDRFTDRDATWRMRSDGSARELLPGGEWEPPSPSGELVEIDGRIVDVKGRTLRTLRFGGLLTACGIVSPPLWSPDGRYLALNMCTETQRLDYGWVLVVPTDGRGVARAVTPRRNGRHPSAASWSPDSRRLLVSDWSGAGYTIARDGSDRRRLTPRFGAHAWSPDSSTIAYVQSGAIMGVPVKGGPARRLVARRSRGTQTREVSIDWSARDELAFSDADGIYVARADGRGLRRVTFRRGELDWSPDGERLVFSSGEIFVVDRRGRGLRRLTEWALDDEPQWSPDGRRLAFVRDASSYSRPQVYVMSFEGKRQRRVGRGSEPHWAPDGRRLVFVRSVISPDSGPPRYRIVVADVDGAGRREIAGLDPAWSPDGERLTFVRHAYTEVGRGWEPYASTLLIARADGSDLRELGDKESLLSAPQWSPDGRTIAVSASSEDLPDGLQLVDVETGAVRKLRDRPDSFAWSPEGRRIAFTDCVGRDSKVAVLAVIDVETGLTRTVARSTGASCSGVPPRYESFAWSPDGTQIGYIRCTPFDIEPMACDAYRVNADGSQRRRITSTPGIERSLDW